MRELPDMMAFVDAAYAIGVISTLLLVGWSWVAI